MSDTPLTPEQEAERYADTKYTTPQTPGWILARKDFLAGHRSRDGEVSSLREALAEAEHEGQSYREDAERFRWLLANMWCRNEGEFRYWQTKLFKDGIPLTRAIDAQKDKP